MTQVFSGQRGSVSNLLRAKGSLRFSLPTGIPSTLRSISNTLAVAWDRFNTARTVAFLIWTILALATTTPSSAGQAQDSYMPSPSPAQTEIQHTTADTDTPTREEETDLSIETLARLSASWGALRIEVPAALQISGSLRETLVAVVDSGIDADIDCLSGRVVHREVLVPDTEKGDAHGTHVAATIAVIAPNSTFLDVTVADRHGRCASTAVARAIRLAADMGAAVINLSLEVEATRELESAIDYAWRKGAVLVAAAGMPVCPDILPSSAAGEGWPDGPCRPALSGPVYPAAYPKTIAVTGINELDELAPVSNRADWVDVAGPGHRTYAEMPCDSQSQMTGTSTAAAHVTGVAALLYGLAEDSNGDGRLNDEVRQAIEAAAEPLQIAGTGHGIVNARTAVEMLLS